MRSRRTTGWVALRSLVRRCSWPTASRRSRVDGRRLAVIGMILIGVVTLSAVRSVWWAIVPMLAGWVIWLATEEILARFGIKLALSGGPLVAQIIVLTMPAASHLAIHFRDDRRREADPRRAAGATLALGRRADPLDGDHRRHWVRGARHQRRHAGPSVRGHPRDLHPRRRPPGDADLADRHAPPLPPGAARAVRLAVARGRGYEPADPLGAPSPDRDCGLGRGRRPASLRGTRPASIRDELYQSLPPDNARRGDYHTVESRLGGIGLVELVAPVGPKLTPEILGKLRGVEERIRAIRVTDPKAVAQVLSLATVLDPDARLAALPADRRSRLLTDKLDLIAASPQGELLRSFWNADAGMTRLLIRLKEQQPAPDKGRIFRHATEEAARDFGPTSYSGYNLRIVESTSIAKALPSEGNRVIIVAIVGRLLHFRIFDRDGNLVANTDETRLSDQSPRIEDLRAELDRFRPPHGPPMKSDESRIISAVAAIVGHSPHLTGLSLLMTRTTEAIITTQWGTFLWSALGIFLMLTLAFRSPVLAVLAILPTLLSVALVLGLMGWLGIQLDMATALVASVALGLSVDDTFHCLLQFHRHRKTRRFRRRLFESYRVSGPGVILSSLAVAIGFAALRASEFEPFVNFGTMVGIATAGSTLGNLVLLPACLTLGRRWGTKAKRPGTVPVPVDA